MIWLAAGGFAASAAMAAVFHLLGIPLAWIFGSMLGAAIYANLVKDVGKTHVIRRTGQWVIGSSVASVLDVETIYDVAMLLPVMVGAAIVANVVAVLISLPLARLARVDRLSAVLASLPAGMAEMSSLAADLNARADFVMVAHSLRVVLVVLAVPILIGIDVDAVMAVGSSAGGTYAALVTCAAVGLSLALVANRLNLLNPWIIMPMTVGVAMVLSGFALAPMPQPLLILAQIAIGFSLGMRLKREDLVRLPRATLAALAAGSCLIGAMLLLAAFVLPVFADLDVATLALGVAPGGLGEMIATAKALGLASAAVACFQFVRSFLTNLLAPLIIVKLVGRKNGGDS